MSYRDDLDAAHARIAMLEEKLGAIKAKHQSELEQLKKQSNESRGASHLNPFPSIYGFHISFVALLFALAVLNLSLGNLQAPPKFLEIFAFLGFLLLTAAIALRKPQQKAPEDRRLSVVFFIVSAVGCWSGLIYLIGYISYVFRSG